MRKKDKMYPFIVPGFAGVMIFVVLPLADVFVSSFRRGGQGSFVGLTNYSVVLDNQAFRLAAGNSLLFELVSVPLLIVVSLVVAIEVYEMKGNIVKFAFLIPLAIPSNSLAVVWKILFAENGIVNGLITKAGGTPISFFTGRAVFRLFVGTFVFKNIGYNMLIWLAGLSAIPTEIYEAARVDGAGRFTRIFKITLPNMKRSFFIVAMLSVVNSLKIFREQYLMAGGYPDTTIYQLQHIFNNWFEKLELGKLTAGAVMTAVVFFGLILIIRVICLTDWHTIYTRLRGGNGSYRLIKDIPARLLHILIRIFVISAAVASVMPLVFLICGTFTNEVELDQILASVIGDGMGYATWHFIPLYPTVKNVVELLFDTPEYYVLFWNSVKIVGVVIAGQLLFAVPAAWGLARSRSRWAKLIFGLYMFCMILPFQVTMLSQYIVLNGMHMINTHWAIILPLVFSTFPIFIMFSAFEQVPASVVEAARLDGAGGFRIFAHMAVPIARKGILSAAILGFLEYWNIVEQPVVFLRDKSLWPLSVYLPEVSAGGAGRAFAFALFSCIPSLIVFYIGRDVLAEGISIGSSDD
ncbi:ABC transporter permease [Coprococcus sp. OM04-5BH]|uniref:ABC transporter permease n=1 Tax=Coprococcus sp. OM04-5BH TaxID=2293093 RepID=UPI001FAAD559|nr:ABC transporter permease subunit [Coprococcus sp. OM04-5BH]